MARELDLSKPLSKADIKFLQSRHPASYVDRMIELAGQSDEEPEAAENGTETDEGAGNGQPAADGSNGSEEGDEDLIGTASAFDPSEHKADEVAEYLKTASDDEKSRVLALEASGKARSTVLNA